MRPTNLIFTPPNVDPGPKYRKVIAIAKQVGGEVKTVTHTGRVTLAVDDKTYEAYLATIAKPKPVVEPESPKVPEPAPEPVRAAPEPEPVEPEPAPVPVEVEAKAAALTKETTAPAPASDPEPEKTDEPVAEKATGRKRAAKKKTSKQRKSGGA